MAGLVQQGGPIKAHQESGQFLGRQFSLRYQPTGVLLAQKLGIDCLVVIHCMGEGHQQSRHADCSQLTHGAGTCAANHQIGVGKGAGGVVNEGHQAGFNAGSVIVVLQCLQMLGTPLMQHQRTLLGRYQ